MGRKAYNSYGLWPLWGLGLLLRPKGCRALRPVVPKAYALGTKGFSLQPAGISPIVIANDLQ